MSLSGYYEVDGQARDAVGTRPGDVHLVLALQRTLGNRAAVQRYDAPAEVTAIPVRQKPYTRAGAAVRDLKVVKGMLAHRPPSWDLSKQIVHNIYRSVDDLMDDLLTTNRLMKVFPTSWTGARQVCWDARNAIGEMYGILHRAEYDARIRGEDDPRPNLLDQRLSEVDFAVPYIVKLENAVSFELPGAEDLPDVPTKFTRLPRSHMHVLAWLQKHGAEIAAAGKANKVDRRAIAGAIAWEAIVKVKQSSIRAVGPGKAHLWEPMSYSAVQQVEIEGYMPQVSSDKRKELLRSPSGAIRYIGAVLQAVSNKSEPYGLSIRNDPGVLTTIYQGWTPIDWGIHMKAKAASHPKGQPWPRPVVANPMGIWVDKHLPYLEEAVGFSKEEQQAIGEKPREATAEGTVASTST